MSGAGRKAGSTPATLAQGAMFAAMALNDMTIEAIAQSTNTKAHEVRYAIEAFKRHADPNQSATPDPDAPPPAPRKIAAGTFRSRAMLALTTDGIFRQLPAEQSLFWAGAVAAVHTHGVIGAELPYARPSFYRSHEEFAAQFGRTVEDLDGLFELGLLEDMDGKGVALPDKFGLRPKPPRVKDPDRPEPTRPSGKQPDRRQAPFIYGIEGGRRGDRGAASGGSGANGSGHGHGPIDSQFLGFAGAIDSQFSGDKSAIDSQIDSQIFGESIPGGDLAHIAAAAAKGLIDKDLKQQQQQDARAGVQGGFANQLPPICESIAPENCESIAPGAPENIPIAESHPEQVEDDAAGAELATLTDIARRLMDLMGITRTPNHKEIRHLRLWLARLPVSVIEGKVREAVARSDWTPKSSLNYFKGIMQDEIARRLAASDPVLPSALPVAQLSPEDEARKAIRKRLSRAATMKDRHSAAPSAPRWDQVEANEAIALEWLDAAEAFEAAGHRGDKPPDWVVYLASRQAPH